MQINKPFANISISMKFLDYETIIKLGDSISFVPKAETNKSLLTENTIITPLHLTKKMEYKALYRM